jgi:alanine racemase
MIRTRIRKIKRRLQRSYDVYNRIEVSRSALLGNVQFFRRKTGLQVIPVLKGNAYGHGIEQVATALKRAEVPYVAVDGYFEALKVRRFSNLPVLIMGMIQPQNFPKLRFRNFTFVVQDEATIHALGKLDKKIEVHVEINTGMNRYGIATEQVSKFANLLQKYPKLQLEGIMSHLADADGTDERTVDAAVEQFDACVDKILKAGFKPKYFHIGQSAGSLRVKSRYTNTLRAGIGLYGINPFPVSHPLYEACQDLKPALRLVSTISKINTLKSGDKVSYNYTFTAPKAMQIGVLPLGYHEGVNRGLSNKGVVKIGAHFRPIAGRICMNHTMIDLTSVTAKVGDEVVVYSDNPSDKNSVITLAKEQSFFPYTTLTDLSPDVRRYLVE